MKPMTLVLCASLAGCAGSEEATQLNMPVTISSAGITQATTDLGYTITITRLRGAIEDVLLTVEGEEHASVLTRMWSWIVPDAHAHPGHLAGGTVTGELLGQFVIDWTDDGASLGTATMLTGPYQAVNFGFRTATADELEPGDPLIGHTFHIQGTAERGGDTVAFDMVLDIEPDTLMVGGLFEYDLTETSQDTLALELLITDPFEGDTLFDGVDFAAADSDGDGQVAIAPGMTEHNIARRTFQIHDHYQISIQ